MDIEEVAKNMTLCFQKSICETKLLLNSALVTAINDYNKLNIEDEINLLEYRKKNGYPKKLVRN